jgi:sulfur carrier protein
MDIRVNGKSESIPSGSTVKSVLAGKDLDPALVSVEYNGVILEKTDLDRTVLSDGDELEILFFMGGGEQN